MQEDLKFEGQEEADRIFRANASPRYKRLTECERWVDGRQYDGLPNFWNDEKPLWDRAPAIVYPIVQIAIESYIDLLLGEGRFPKFSAKPGEDESDDEDGGLGPDDSDTIDRFVLSWHRASQFRAVSAEAIAKAMGSSSVAVIHGVRDSRPFSDVIPGAWCEPKLDATGNVLRLEIRYPYQEQYKHPQSSKWSVRTRLYRRVIDDQWDREYQPGDGNEQGVEPQWQVNAERSVQHGFGVCPVVWYPFMRGCVPVNVIDGKPVHENITDEIRAHDIARSQWHRGALMSEPQPYEIGVAPGHNPTEIGEMPRAVSTELGGSPSPKNPVTGYYQDKPAGVKAARKRGPGYVWQYPNEKTQVGAIEYPGDALKAQEDNCRDLRMKLMEALAVVLLDPESFRAISVMSGRALQAIKQKQLDRCDKIREDLSERYFQRSIALQLRIARAVLKRNGALQIPGAKKAKVLLVGGDDKSWQPPRLSLRWGEYFRADPEEQQQLVTMCVQALECEVPFLTVRAVVEKVAPLFGIENVKAFLEELQNESDARAKAASDARQEELKAAMAHVNGGKPDGGPEPKSNSRGAAVSGDSGSKERSGQPEVAAQ